MKKIAVWAALTVVSIGLISCNENSEKRRGQIAHNVFLIEPKSVDGSSVREFAGRVEEARNVAAAFKTAGQLEKIYVKEGDRVRRGQLLAVLDSADYVIGVNQLRIQAAQIASESARHAKLHASGGMSDNDYEKVTAGAKQIGLQLALNEKKIQYCRLTAPTDGVVTSVKFEPGEMVDAGTPVVDIMDNSHLEVVVDLPVSEYLRRSYFTGFSGRTPRFPGHIFHLNMLSITPRSDNNQLFQMKLNIASGSGVTLTPGMNLTVCISTDGDGKGAVAIPASAVFDYEGKPAVWVYNPADSTIQATQIEVAGTGDADGSLIVTTGLKTTESVVKAGVHHLTNGEKVNVIAGTTQTNAGNIL